MRISSWPMLTLSSTQSITKCFYLQSSFLSLLFPISSHYLNKATIMSSATISLLTIFVCVCIQVHAPQCSCEVRGQPQVLGLTILPCLRQYTRLAGPWPSKYVSYLFLGALGLQMLVLNIQLLHGFWGLKPGPHLPTEPCLPSPVLCSLPVPHGSQCSF